MLCYINVLQKTALIIVIYCLVILFMFIRAIVNIRTIQIEKIKNMLTYK